MTTMGCHDVWMSNELTNEELLEKIKQARALAIEHTVIARRYGAERAELMRALMQRGVSRAEIARELGVSRQAVQKMLAL
jgi:orotate phosphoribosyltransferase-like protein